MEIRLQMRLQPPGFLGLVEQMKNGLDVIGQRREMNGFTLRRYDGPSEGTGDDRCECS